jgi:solute carrier family 25 carnitine/acylcarnitine transporter 20/29
LASPLAGSALLNAVLFGAYERSLSQFQKYFIRNEEGYSIGPIPLHYYFYAGAIGGLASTFVTCPVDVVKNKMQVMGLGHGYSATSSGAEGAKKKKSLTTFDVFKLTLRTGGIRGIYLGMVPTLYRDIPGYGVYFFVYEGLKRKLGITGSEHEALGGSTHEGANIFTVIFAGGTAGMIYHGATYPIDVVKSVIQIQKTDEKGRPIEFKGTADCFKQIYRLYGWKGFINGIGPTVIKSFPASGVGFAVYEITLKLLP